MDSFDDINNFADEEDNFSDTDDDEEWQKEATLTGPQTTYV